MSYSPKSSAAGRIYNARAWRKAGYTDSPAQKAFEETQRRMREDPKGFLKNDAIEPVYPLEAVLGKLLRILPSIALDSFVNMEKRWRKSELSAKNAIVDTGFGAGTGHVTRNMGQPKKVIVDQGMNYIINEYKVKEWVQREAVKLVNKVPSEKNLESMYQHVLEKIKRRLEF
ncbi:MAG: hypothetical protein ACTSXQ_08050 [Alphaproteobacteria bacterium]